jgi:hypothetical protein
MCPVNGGKGRFRSRVSQYLGFVPGHGPVWLSYFIGHAFVGPVVGHLGVRYGGGRWYSWYFSCPKHGKNRPGVGSGSRGPPSTIALRIVNVFSY